MNLEHIKNCPALDELLVRLNHEIKDLCEELTGTRIDETLRDVAFLQLGFDHVLLTLIAQEIQRKYNVVVSFRNLVDGQSSLRMLVYYLAEHLTVAMVPQPDCGESLLPETSSPERGSHLITDPCNSAEQEIPLTGPQLEILLAAQTGNDASCCFNECFSLHLTGALDYGALEASWRATVMNRDALRMTIAETGNFMRLRDDLNFDITRDDLRSLQESEYRDVRRSILEREGSIPFDLERGPLIRARLLAKCEDEHELIITVHHIVCDGWSINIIIEELGERYSAIVENRSPLLEPAKSYRDYALSLAGSAAENTQTKSASYWKNEFQSIPVPLDLPINRPRVAKRSFNGSTFISGISPELVSAVQRAGAEHGCTLFATLLGVWQVLLSRLGGNPEIVTLIPFAANTLIEDATLVGQCAYLLPIRSRIAPEKPIETHLRRLQGKVLDAREHHDFTYGSLVQFLNLSAPSGRLPLSEVQFNVERLGRSVRFCRLTVDVRANAKLFVNFDLSLNIVEGPRGLRLECDFNTDLYDQATIARWLRYYRNLLADVAANPATPTGALAMLDETERDRLARKITETYKPYPRDLSLPELIAQRLKLYPDSIAVECNGRRVSRRELGAEASALAAYLQQQGVGPGSLVGVYMDRSIEMLVAIAGVLGSGAAYVPLDPIYPRERVAAILRDADVVMVLTLERNCQELPSGYRTVCLDQDQWRKMDGASITGAAITPESLAYVIFISDPTGKPKGVEVTHRSVVNLLCAVETEIGIQSHDRLLAVTAITFDIATLELLLPIISGATLIIAQRDDVADGARLLDMLLANEITVLQAMPETWRMLLDAGFESTHDFKMLCSDESWTRTMADRLLPGGGRLWNMYGITETTIWSSVNEIAVNSGPIAIGPPMANTQFYALDGNMQEVPAGSTGELFIGGDGVARGYHRQSEQTRARFLPDPFRPGTASRLYRTGDLVRHREDGRLQYLGRTDQQIKLRGFRIELEEIERAIMNLEEVDRAVVQLRTDSNADQRLVAYLTTKDSVRLESRKLREALLRKLPEYMVPSHFQLMNALPVTTNQKIDRRMLPDPEWSSVARVRNHVAPETALHKQMAAIWEEVLGVEGIGINDKLIDLGADSLKMFQISSRASRNQMRVTAKQLIQLPTIAALCEDIERVAKVTTKGNDAGPITRVSRDSYRIGAEARQDANVRLKPATPGNINNI
jgi:amino acid adenylation domain-containing protein